ncbi:DUF4194 domain-containing protein [Agrobacterium rubi]|nr:DUF4194 domain-containing protein [Agrobacterium rubi]NTF24917.1 DUF4194 domain-containing protein [Agrobacterium rubi]
MLLDVFENTFPEEEKRVGIQKAIAHLNRFQFWHSESQANTLVRNALANPFTRKFIREAFQCMGYRFVEDDRLGYYGIVPGEDIPDSRTVTELETFVLLGLKHAFDKGFDQGDTDQSGSVETSFNSFFDDIASFTSSSDWQISNSDLRAVLKKLSSFGVVALDNKKDDEDDIPMKIRPFISDILNIDVIARLENFVKRKNGQDDSAMIEVETEDRPENVQE